MGRYHGAQPTGPGNISYTRLCYILKRMIQLQQILDFIPNASTAELKTILNNIQNELPKREGTVDNYVVYIENFCSDSVLLDLVWAECESMNLTNKRNKTASKWLSSSKKSYFYTDTDPEHPSNDIILFPAIKKLGSIVSESSEVTGPLDACLVLKYNSTSSSLSIHDDGEFCIDQEKSICPLSLGCERTLEFYDNASVRKPKMVKSIRMKNNSLVIMRPGTQQKFKHAVRAEPKSKDSGPKDQIRYVLSYRAVKSTNVPTVSSAPTVASPPSPPNIAAKSPVEYVNLVAGDSHAARLDAEKLGKGKHKVKNIAVGGAKIDMVQKQLKTFADANPGTVVNKIIVSVGTNDIRNCRDIGSLRGPLKTLCKNIDDMYPNSKIFFQSLIPLPIKDEKDWLTNSRVQDFNRIIYNECVYRHYYFIDVFYPLTRFKRLRHEPVKRFDKLFERNGIHLNKECGLGVLARFYIRAIHSKYFNPRVYQ